MASLLSKAGVWNKLITQVNQGKQQYINHLLTHHRCVSI